MKIKRNTKTHGNICPKASNFLSNLPKKLEYNESYENMPPTSSIYSKSLRKVVASLEKVLSLKERAEIIPENGPPNPVMTDLFLEELPTAQRNLLQDIFTYIDNCYRIIKATYPPKEVYRPNITNEKWIVLQWLKSARHPTYKSFQKQIEPYRESLNRLVNITKHEDAKIALISLIPNNSHQTIPGYHIGTKLYMEYPNCVTGYYLETYSRQHQSHGPDEIVHNRDTAISFNRDISYHIYNIYKISEHLVSAIEGAYRHCNLASFSVRDWREPNSNSDEFKLEKLFERISTTPDFFFPNEIGSKNPYVDFVQRQNGKILELGVSRENHYYWNTATISYSIGIVESQLMKFPCFEGYPKIKGRSGKRFSHSKVHALRKGFYISS